MTALATFQDDAFAFSGRGVDCLAGDLPSVGCSAVFDVDYDTVGGNSALALDAFVGGAQAIAVEVAQTGSVADETALLAGASGVDTLGDVETAATGFGLAAEGVVPATGINSVWGHEAVETSVSCDLRVTVILHRIATFSALAPAPVGFPDGHGF